MKIHNMDQQSPEWFKARELKMTASHAQSIASSGKGLETYCKNLVMEYLYPETIEHYSNKHTDRGNDLEDSARTLYEFETGNSCKEVGFCEFDENTGASPDSLVEEDGLNEIKCPDGKAYFQVLLDKKIESNYMWQMQMQMYVCDKNWCDYVVYNPNFKDKSIIIIRVGRDESKIEKIKAGLEKGKALIKNYLKEIKG